MYEKDINKVVSKNLVHITTVRAPGGPEALASLPTDWELLCEEVPELGKYEKKARNIDQLKRCLINLYDHQRLSETDVALVYLERANEIVVSEQQPCQPPSWSKGDRYPPLISSITSTSAMNQKSNPGYPWCLDYSTKRDFIAEDITLIHTLTIIRMMAWVHIGVYLTDPIDLLNTFCVDPAIACQKNEISSVGKDSRIFKSCSIITENLHRFIYSDIFESNKRYWGFNYSSIGIGMTLSHSDRLHSTLDSELCTSDVPKMDVTVTPEEIQLDAANAIARYGVSPESLLYKLIEADANISPCQPMVLTNGEVWLSRRGCTETGRYTTGHGNTEKRYRRSVASSLWIRDRDETFVYSQAKAAGDDCIETYHPMRYESYTALSFPIRDFVKQSRDELFFCSNLWPRGADPIGQRPYKAAAHLLFLDHPSPEQVGAFCKEYHGHPAYPRLVSVMLAHRPSIKLYSNLLFSLSDNN